MDKNNSFLEYVNKEIEYLRNRNQILNEQNTALFKIMYEMRELIVKFYNYPKKLNNLNSELQSKDLEIQLLKNKSNLDLKNLENKLKQQIENDNNENKSKESTIDSLQRTIQDIESQKNIDNNEFVNQIIDYKSKIQEYQENQVNLLKNETLLKEEIEWIKNSKSNELINSEESKKEVEKQLADSLREVEQLKLKVSNYQQKLHSYQQRQQQQQQSGHQQQQPGHQQQMNHQNSTMSMHSDGLGGGSNSNLSTSNIGNNNSGGGSGNHLNNHNILSSLQKKPLQSRKPYGN